MGDRDQADAGIVDSSAALASLYQVPLGEFVARRTALVTQFRKSGHKDVAARLAGATKPSRVAYLLNQVFWRARDTYDGVLEAGSAARAAQQARLLGDGGEDLGGTLRLRDAAIDEAVAQAEHIAADEGLGASGAVAAQVRASFEALAAHGRETRLQHGQLIQDVELPGLGALAGLMLPATATPPARQFQVVARRADPPPSSPSPDPRLEAAERRVAEARTRETAARERSAELARSLDAVRAQVGQAREAVATAARQLDVAERALAKGEAAHAAALTDMHAASARRSVEESALAALRAGDVAPPATSSSGRRRGSRTGTSGKTPPPRNRPRR